MIKLQNVGNLLEKCRSAGEETEVLPMKVVYKNFYMKEVLYYGKA